MKMRNEAENEQPLKSKAGFMAASWIMMLCVEPRAGSQNCEKWWIFPADHNISVNKLKKTPVLQDCENTGIA